uniref:BTB domain-containing protein n=1 Tax=Panagrolaimus sp. ES5 TaxID=591445 RepID=A0AC34FC07_9BILA
MHTVFKKILELFSGFCAFLNSNGGYYIGALLSQWNFEEIKTKETKVLTLFENFSNFDKRSFGRQIATSPGAQTLKELLFISDQTPLIHKWHKLIIDLLMNAFEFRDAFERENLDRIVQEYDSSDTKLKLLSVFNHDSWSRTHLRFCGGLKLVMEELSDTFDTRTFFIVKNLSFFMHDSEGLIHICRNDAFLDKILFLLQKYCNETRDKDCPPLENKLTLRPDSPNFLQHLEEKRQNMNITNFYVDFADLEASIPAQCSSSPRIRSAWSPSASRTSATPSPSPSPSSSTFSDDESDTTNWISHPKKEDIGWYSDSELDEDQKEMCREKRRDKIVLYLLDIIDWLTHYPENHIQLLRKPVFETLIALSSTELPINAIAKACRSIKRLIRSEESLPYLFGLKLHLHIISLIRRPCLMHRYADRCSRCEDRRKFGREVLEELSLQANSGAGWNFMQELLKSDNPNTQFYAFSTALTLIRHVQYRSRLFYYFDVLTKLHDSLKLILKIAANEGNKFVNPEDDEEEESNSTNVKEVHQARIASLEENKPKLEAILFSFASLLSHKMQSSILETQTEPFPLDSTDEQCRLENAEILPEKQIRFKNASGEILVTADRDSLISYSEYYRGMFENNFAEKLEGQQEFIFGNEGMHIRDEQFVKFIHLLSGCKKSQCVAVDETSTCVSLIYLADKYLATELLETMFLPTGIVGRFITGSTLSSFIPIILTCLSTHGRFSDLFFFVFLRYASMNEIFDTLAESLSFSSGETFCDLFKEFLQRCISSLPSHQSYRLWI